MAMSINNTLSRSLHLVPMKDFSTLKGKFFCQKKMQASASASEGSAAKYRLDGFDVWSICSTLNRFDSELQTCNFVNTNFTYTYLVYILRIRASTFSVAKSVEVIKLI